MDATLFTGAIDMVEYLDSTQPCPSYRGAFDTWSENLPGIDEIEASEADHANLESYINLVGNSLTLFIESASPLWRLKPVAERVEHIQSLLNKPNVAQRSQAWYDQSRTVLTASEFASILGTPRAVGSLAFQKTQPPREHGTNSAIGTAEMSPMDWGVRFEPVVKQVLETMWDATILDIGRIIHPTDPTLAASPDGLILKASDPDRVGRLLEIKCPVKRLINDTIPFEYWCQMQIQMEVTDIDECEYVEMKIVSPYKNEPYVAPTVEPIAKGNVWIVQDVESCVLKYAYTADEVATAEKDGYAVIETIPWHVERVFNSILLRDRAWFISTAEKRAEFWKCVSDTASGAFVLAPSTRIKQVKQIVTVCKITDSL
jgi:putative phage-type endonuclease